MIVVVDNRDSFVFNLARHFQLLGVETVVVPSHGTTAAAILATSPAAIVISPGPCTPVEAGCSLDLVRAARGRVPLLGVCLGHQAVAAAVGGRVVRATVEGLFPTPDTCTAGGPDDVLVVTGSIYLLGEIMARIQPERGAGEGRLQDF